MIGFVRFLLFWDLICPFDAATVFGVSLAHVVFHIHSVENKSLSELVVLHRTTVLKACFTQPAFLPFLPTMIGFGQRARVFVPYFYSFDIKSYSIDLFPTSPIFSLLPRFTFHVTIPRRRRRSSWSFFSGIPFLTLLIHLQTYASGCGWDVAGPPPTGGRCSKQPPCASGLG